MDIFNPQFTWAFRHCRQSWSLPSPWNHLLLAFWLSSLLVSLLSLWFSLKTAITSIFSSKQSSSLNLGLSGFIYKLIYATLFTLCCISTTALVYCLLSQICASSPNLSSGLQICVSKLPDGQQSLEVSKAPETQCNQNILDPNSISAPSVQFKS